MNGEAGKLGASAEQTRRGSCDVVGFVVEHHLEHETVTDGVAFGVGLAVDKAGGICPVDAEEFVDVTGEVVAGDLDPDV